MTHLRIVPAASPEGKELLHSIDRRGDAVLDPKVLQKTSRLIDNIRRDGDRALVNAARRFDGSKAANISRMRLRYEDVEPGELPEGFEDALETAIASVESYHRHQVHEGEVFENDGVELEERRLAMRRVGVYVPGGRASYPSTVLMTVIPAKIAGVREIAVATPPGSWHRSPALRRTLQRLGVQEVWGMGGAHAVAALAYGTETIERVDKIVGPGNAWVTAAKHLVSTKVGIDSLAGPSEVVIVADSAAADPDWVAADMLAQAEHDPQAMALLITDDNRFAKNVGKAIQRRIPQLNRGEHSTGATARQSIEDQGAALIVKDMKDALPLVDRIAPEHLQLVGPNSEAIAPDVRNAGAIFVGALTPEVFGDYVAGPSHVLPTTGAARFSSALGVEDFVRRSHVVKVSAAASPRLAAAAAALADVEGLPAHAASARLRLGEEK